MSLAGWRVLRLAKLLGPIGGWPAWLALSFPSVAAVQTQESRPYTKLHGDSIVFVYALWLLSLDPSSAATSAGDLIAKIFSSLACSPLGALISKTPSVAAERKARRRKRGGGGGSDLVSLAQSIDDEEDEDEDTHPGLILDLTTHNHQHLGGAAGAVAAGGGAAAAAAAAVAAAAAAGVPPAGAVSVNAPSASAGGAAGGGIVGVPHHLGGLLGAAGVGAMPGPSGGGGVGGGGGDMVHDLILEGPGATGLCSATAASLIAGNCIRSPSPTRLAYTSEKHPRSTFHELNMIRKHQDLCDVMIHVGSRKILAHKYVSIA